MNRVGVDTNVVVSFLTDRDLDQQARAAELFAGSAAGEHVVAIHQSVITETVYVMGNAYGVQPAKLSRVMADLLALPGVVDVHDTHWPALWRVWPRRIRDFGDACLVVAAESGQFDTLATFDATFAGRARRRGLCTSW